MAWLLGFWTILKKMFGWAWQNKNAAGYIILVAIIVWLNWSLNKVKKDNEKLVIEKEGLPENIEFIGEIKGNKFKVTYKDSNGATIHKEYYVPSEGSIKFTKYINLKQYDPNAGFSGKTTSNLPSIPSLNPFNNLVDRLLNRNEKKQDGQLDTDVKIIGFTFRPGIAAIYDGGFKQERPITVGIDAKLFYISRYSSGIGSTIDYPYIFISRHVDDLIPFIPINNLEATILYGKPYSNFSSSVFAIGGRTNF